jgi:dUTP pyrophosphatase
MTIKLKKLRETAQLPAYQTDGAIAFDLSASEPVKWKQINVNELKIDGKAVICYNADFSENIPIFEAVIPTGLAIELPENIGMLIYPRSGWGFKFNISLANGTALIDSDYRGEIMVKLIAIGPKELPEIEIGTRIAQATITQVLKPDLCFVEELNETKRGTSGFGSTGHK